LIENRQNVGFARANNQAMRASSARYVLLLNSDTIIPRDALERLLAFTESHSQAGIVGAKLINPDGSFQASHNSFPNPVSVVLEGWGLVQRFPRNRYYPSAPPGKSTSPTVCDWVGGACLLARREAIAKVGLLDESFFMNSEEVDWCYRMRRAGWQVWYTPDVEIIHIGGGSAERRTAVQRLRLYEGKVRFLRKHHGPIVAGVARFNFRLASLTKATVLQFAYWSTRRDVYRRQAASHWPVVWRQTWV
jgi:hypothetical protein